MSSKAATGRSSPKLTKSGVALLSRVSGLNSLLASNIVAYRNENGPFKARTGLKKVPRMGPKTFEQAAGFLRVMQGDNPLDASAVHPEAYPRRSAFPIAAYEIDP